MPTLRCFGLAPFIGLAVLLGTTIPVSDAIGADPPWRPNQKYQVRRLARIETDAESVPAIAVVEFLGHGQLTPHAANVAIFDHSGPIPWKILQSGPGDFCRVAFPTAGKAGIFQIYYGGEEPETPPAWSGPTPLLLETRHWKECNLNSLESVQAAFAAAASEGSNFVESVFYRWNPITLAPRPFLSRYTGMLQADKGGDYAFFTSSEDASFLLIDGKEIVAAPGRHGPSGQASVKGQVNLKRGAHQFEYWHAASDVSACMVAAWQPPGAGKPEVIPAATFSSSSFALIPATTVRKRSGALVPDFAFQSVGEVALEDGDAPLVRVRFMDVTSPRKSTGAKVHWEFGDGQSSGERDPVHVYLRPGSYQVKLTRQKDGPDAEAVNAIRIERPLVLPAADHQPDELKSYLPMLEAFDSSRCDGPALLQLVRAFEQLEKWSAAVSAAQPALTREDLPLDEESRYLLVQRVGRILRDQLLNSGDAAAAWTSAAEKLAKPEWRAHCQLEAADLMVNELGNIAEARKLSESAARMSKNGAADPDAASRLQRVRGDVLARQGDGKGARGAYQLATRLLQDRRNEIARNAWRGARSRSVEAYLREGDLHAARRELDLWLAEFPEDKIEGYLPLLQARYWVARKAWAQASAVAGDLLMVNSAAPYADQLVLIAALSEKRLGQPARAADSYRKLLTEYPGSPLVEEAQKELDRLETENAADPDSERSK